MAGIEGLTLFAAPPACVYFLLDEGVVVYVGETLNLPRRIVQHTADKVFDRVYYVPARGTRFSLESQYIARFRPRYNDEYRQQHADWAAATQLYVPPGITLERLREWQAEAPRSLAEVLRRYVEAFPATPNLKTLPPWLVPATPAGSGVARG